VNLRGVTKKLSRSAACVGECFAVAAVRSGRQYLVVVSWCVGFELRDGALRLEKPLCKNVRIRIEARDTGHICDLWAVRGDGGQRV